MDSSSARFVTIAVALAGACTPDTQQVGEQQDDTGTETVAEPTGSSGTDPDSSGGSTGSDSGATSSSESDSGSESSGGDTTGGDTFDACMSPEQVGGEQDQCEYPVADPCDEVEFMGPADDPTLVTPEAAECVLAVLQGSENAVVRVSRYAGFFAGTDEIFLVDEAEAVVDVDGSEDFNWHGLWPRTFARPDAAEFAGCSVAGPAAELYACLHWWLDAECIGTPRCSGMK